MSDTPPRRSPIDDRHRALGASTTTFAGWDMPLDYGSVVAEHRAVRQSAGAFDLSHLGTLTVTGTDAAEALQAALTNDVTTLDVGRAHYTLCLNDDGGVIDDLLVYRLAWGFFVVPNAANAEAVRAAIDASTRGFDDATVRDVGDDLACIAMQGPQATDVVTAAGVDVSGMRYLDVRSLDLASPDGDATPSWDPAWEGGVLARTGYTGELGYELFCRAPAAGSLWDRVIAAGAAPAGLGCRDTLRMEMGYPLHGQELAADRVPLGARVAWAIKAGTGFRGEQAWVAAKAAGPTQRSWGVKVRGRGIPRAHCAVNLDGEAVGEVTSGTFSPTLGQGIGLAALRPDVGEGAEVVIDVRGREVPAEVVEPPLIERG